MYTTGLRALTQTQADEIKALDKTERYSQRELAELFGVSQGTISNIVTGRLYVTEQTGHMRPELR